MWLILIIINNFFILLDLIFQKFYNNPVDVVIRILIYI